MSLNLSPKARQIIEQLRDDTGVPNTEALTRILEWFAAQDRKLRLAILNRDLDTKRELVRLALREMAGIEDGAGPGAGANLSFDEAARVVERMLDHMRSIEASYRRELQEDAGKAGHHAALGAMKAAGVTGAKLAKHLRSAKRRSKKG